MRLSVASLRRMIKGKLPVEFVHQELTSYSGLELLRRYLRQHDLPRRLRAACAATGGDYGGGRLALLVLALLYVGARRLEHLRYVAGDPLIARFCGLPRLTIDVDGTVVRTGATVGWAFRGFNPHHRKDPSYYPLLAHVAQTGHILRVKNRPGNVHDSKQSGAFLREVITGLRSAFGRRLPLEFRMDAAFFQRDVLRLVAAQGCAYAIKVGYWHWLPLKQLAAERERWRPVAPHVTGFFHDLSIPQWKLRLRVMIYRKHVGHESPKNFQLDLFTPDDGHFEYAAVATNLALDLPALYAFICGRGAQEKTIAELKGEFALDVIPTRHYGANSAWQQLSILAHNLIRSFQLDTLAVPKPRSRKRTYTYLIRSMRTLRFLLVTRAGRLTRIGGRHVLRLSHNPATEALYASIDHRLAA